MTEDEEDNSETYDEESSNDEESYDEDGSSDDEESYDEEESADEEESYEEESSNDEEDSYEEDSSADEEDTSDTYEEDPDEGSGSSSGGSGAGGSITSIADSYVGGKYVYGGSSLSSGVDCSHFVWLVLQQAGAYSGGYMTSGEWAYAGSPVSSLSEAQAGAAARLTVRSSRSAGSDRKYR